MWQKGHLQCLAVPCPPLEVPRQLGLTLPTLTVAPTVFRYSDLSCPPPPREGAKTEPRLRPRGDPGLRSTPPFRKRKACEFGLVGQVSPNLSGQELSLGSAWAVQPGISDLWALRDPW